MKRTARKPIVKPRGKIVSTHCCLCTKPATLQHSYIIPELCYRPLYDPKHRATLLNLDENRRTFLQKGLREHLLCKKCEGKLSKWEALFKRQWLGNPAFKQPVNGPFTTITGLPWPAFKLFHLSILWRMSIATRQEFDAVGLGTKYNETIRQMLDLSDPGKPEEFPSFCEVMTDDHGKPLFDLITQPHESRFDGKRAYGIAFAGAVWIYVVTQREEPGLRPFYPPTANQRGQLIAVSSSPASHITSTPLQHNSQHGTRQHREYDASPYRADKNVAPEAAIHPTPAPHQTTLPSESALTTLGPIAPAYLAFAARNHAKASF